MERGKIHSRERAKQQRDYSGLRYGNITPTDIDGVIEYRNHAYLFIELKYMNPDLDYGQRLAFERIADDLATIKPTIYILAIHDIHDTKVDIPVAECYVDSYRLNRSWETPMRPMRVKELIDSFIDEIDDAFIGNTSTSLGDMF